MGPFKEELKQVKTRCVFAGLAEPVFEHRHDWFVAILYSSTFIKDDEQRWLEQFHTYGFNQRQLKALVYTKHNIAGIINSEYRDVNNMNRVGDDRKANWELTRLVNAGLMIKNQGNRNRRYLLDHTKLAL